MYEIMAMDNPNPSLMGYLAFVPLYEDMCLLAGTNDTSIQPDRNAALESGYLRCKNHLVAYGKVML